MLCTFLVLIVMPGWSSEQQSFTVTQVVDGHMDPAKLITGTSRPEDHTLWYPQPARTWEEALPLGNGRLGAMVHGRVGHERIQINEESLWAGSQYETYPDNFKDNLTKLQDLVLADKIGEADIFGLKHLVKSPTSFKPYEPLADLVLDLNPSEPVTDYRRELDLLRGIASVTYRIGAVTYRREMLISAVDDVVAIHLTADQAGAINLSATLTRHKDMVLSLAGDGSLDMVGQIVDVDATPGKDRKPGGSGPGGAHMKFFGKLVVKATGGTMQGVKDAITIAQADEVLLLFSAATDYNLATLNFDRSIDPRQITERIIAKAAVKSWEAIKTAHVSELRSLMDRVTLDLGTSVTSTQPVDQRIAAVAAGVADPGLATLYFNYGRYLLASGSRRPGRLPLNLQGIWNHELWAPWESDYHLNINLQMNYWPVDVCNQSENIEALVDWFTRMVERGRISARTLYGSSGWMLYTCTNAFGRSTPSGSTLESQYKNGSLDPLAGAWMAMTLWDHFEFTQDHTFLAEKAYPILKGAAQFMLDYMRSDRDGHLVIVPSTSPENQFIDPVTKRPTRLSRASTYHMTIVRVVFTAVMEGSRILGIDGAFRAELATALTKLPPLRVSARGTIQEWIEDYEEQDPKHRHVSHLLGLHPFSIITSRDSTLFEAAKKTLERRGFGGDVGWSNAWKINFYARLGDASQAEFYVNRLIGRNTFPNLMDSIYPGRVFQIDANFAGTAGIAEMLLQSHAQELHLLPALPATWPNGSLTGLKARGGFVVDIAWKNGVLTTAVIHSLQGQPCRVRYGAVTTELVINKGRSAVLSWK